MSAPAPPSGRGARFDPDALAALEEQRDFLLRSLDDLEREREAGDVDDVDYRELKDDYTARAAAVLRAIEAQEARIAAPRTRSRGSLLAWLGGTVVVAVLAGVLLVSASEPREEGGVITGDVDGLSDRLLECQPLVFRDPEAAIGCYEEVLADAPGNATALTYQGWATVRAGRPEEGEALLREAVATDPDLPDPHVFLASVAADRGDLEAASAELDRVYELDPPPDVLSTLEQMGLPEEVALGLLPDDVAACWEQSRDAFASADTVIAALECFEAVLAERPADAAALLTQAYVEVEIAVSFGIDAYLDRATENLTRVLAAEPGQPDALLLSAVVANERDQPAEALAALDELGGARTSPLFDVDPTVVRSIVEERLAGE